MYPDTPVLRGVEIVDIGTQSFSVTSYNTPSKPPPDNHVKVALLINVFWKTSISVQSV